MQQGRSAEEAQRERMPHGDSLCYLVYGGGGGFVLAAAGGGGGVDRAVKSLARCERKGGAAGKSPGNILTKVCGL